MKSKSRSFSFLFLFFLFVFAMLFPPFSFCADPWELGHYRDIAKSLGGWTYPQKAVSGTTAVYVDVTKSGVIIIDSDDATSGISIFFSGIAKVPTRTWVVWEGDGKAVDVSETGYDPFVYGEDDTWPFPRITTDGYLYAMEVLSGLQGIDGVAGETVYGVSGVTIYD